ncbi:MAG TPA: type II secretion system F family protein [Dehalococcoidia bacterium]|nr:type II secretion system F family protein [Dehalococcoidia bacterium]
MIEIVVAASAFATGGLLAFAVFTRATSSSTARARLSNLSGAGYEDVPVWLEPDLLTPRRPVHLPMLEMFVQNRSWASRLEMQLAQAAVPMRASEYVLLRIAGLLVVPAIALVAFGLPPLAGLVAAPFGYLLPRMWLSFKRSSRISKLNKQLPDTVSLIASSLKAGFALLQAFEAAADRAPEPMASELARTIRDVSLGATMEDAISGWGQRIPGPDLQIIVNAILIQRTVGGNLGEILDNVGHTMRERERLYGEIRALTAQQRLSGFVVGALPAVVAVAYTLLNPEYMAPLFTEPIGNAILATAAVMEVLSFVIIMKILDIDI